MTSVYVDTSGALACLFATRTGHRAAREAWAAADAVISVRLIHVEACAALAALKRAGSLRPSAHTRAKKGWRRLREELTVIETDAELVDQAADLAERYLLRGCDAVHLAGIQASGCGVMLSADRELCRASVESGIDVIDLLEVE